MNTKEKHLLEQTIGQEVVRTKVRTRTCIDVGLWWWQRPLWLCITDTELVILAIARRRHVERIALSCCSDIHYSPASGELVIISDPPLRFPRLRMPLSTALQLIDLIQLLKQSSSPTPPQSHD